MAVVNDGSRRQAPELFDLATELEDDAFAMLEAITRLQDTLSALVELCPESLDEGSDDED